MSDRKESSQGKVVASAKQLVQIGVRDIDQPPGTAMETVIYDPGRQDSDQFIYCSSPSKENNGHLVIEFQLQHE